MRSSRDLLSVRALGVLLAGECSVYGKLTFATSETAVSPYHSVQIDASVRSDDS